MVPRLVCAQTKGDMYDSGRKRGSEAAAGPDQKNRYTQGSKRDRVFEEPAGWGDCSSTIREGFKKALGIDIGANTAMQIVSKKGRDIDIGNGAIYPNESKLLPGDCLYFKGTDTSRPFSVGHVEMYIGNGQLLGHGSGIGPTIKRLQTYCKGRHTSGKGYIKTRRFIWMIRKRGFIRQSMDVRAAA